MKQPFVTSLRAAPGTLTLGDGSQSRITLRVQGVDTWDSLRIEAPPSESVLAVKLRALEAVYPNAEYHEDYAMKLGGIEVLDEEESLSEAGARDGSIFLLMHRRRRPVK